MSKPKLSENEFHEATDEHLKGNEFCRLLKRLKLETDQHGFVLGSVVVYIRSLLKIAEKVSGDTHTFTQFEKFNAFLDKYS